MAKFPCKVPNWERRLRKGESILPDPKKLDFFSEEAADAGWELFSDFRLVALPGAPRMGTVTPPWIEEMVRYWMGAVDPATGARSVQEALLLVSKKNTKSSTCALMILAQFLTARQPNAQALIIAPTIQVADMAFRLIVGAIESTPGLDKCYKPLWSDRVIKDQRPGWQTQLKVASADLNVLVGTTASWIFLDELHVLGEMNGAEYLMEHVRGARVGNPAASLLMATTHAHEIPTGTWRGELKAFREIRDGTLDQPKLFVSYEWPQKDLEKGRHLDPKNWFMTNPNMGVTVDLDKMIEQHEFEKSKGPEAEAGWRQQFTNLSPEWNNPPNAWSGARYWLSAVDDDPELGDPTIKGLDALLRRCETVVIGIDGGGLYDLLGLVVLGREPGRGRWLCWAHAWAHVGIKDTHYEVWEKIKGFVNTGEISLVDYSATGKSGERSINLSQMSLLCSYVHSHGKFLPKHSVGIDKGKMGLLADCLHDPALPCPIPFHQVCKIEQGPSLALTADMLGLRVSQGTLLHGNQPMMNWQVNNVLQEPRGNGFVIQKQNLAKDAKIDNFVALLCAARLFEASPDSFTQIRVARAIVRYNDELQEG